MRLVVAVDKYRGTATQAELSREIAAIAKELGVEAMVYPTADGGEGLLEAFGGANRTARVCGPLGDPVDAPWIYDIATNVAVIESALASGLQLIGGAAHNDPWKATSQGTGELILVARAAGARSIVVGLGGSACTDGGRGLVDAIVPALVQDPGLGVAVTVCVDVSSSYLHAAELFGPQKGADRQLVRHLTDRLHFERERLIAEFAVDPQLIYGSGAAGGMGGGLAALGATMTSGFEYVARHTGLAQGIELADLVLTGEGRFDATSLNGKVVGGVAAMASSMQTDVVAIVGDLDQTVTPDFPIISLVARHGRDRALNHTLASVRTVVADLLSSRLARTNKVGNIAGEALLRTRLSGEPDPGGRA